MQGIAPPKILQPTGTFLAVAVHLRKFHLCLLLTTDNSVEENRLYLWCKCALPRENADTTTPKWSAVLLSDKHSEKAKFLHETASSHQEKFQRGIS